MHFNSVYGREMCHKNPTRSFTWLLPILTHFLKPGVLDFFYINECQLAKSPWQKVLAKRSSEHCWKVRLPPESSLSEFLNWCLHWLTGSDVIQRLLEYGSSCSDGVGYSHELQATATKRPSKPVGSKACQQCLSNYFHWQRRLDTHRAICFALLMC